MSDSPAAPVALAPRDARLRPSADMWPFAGAFGAMLALGVLLARPLFVLAAAAIGVLLLGEFYRTTRLLRDLPSHVSLSAVPAAPQRSARGFDFTVTVRASDDLPGPVTLDYTVHAAVPGTASRDSLRLDPGGDDSRTYRLRFDDLGRWPAVTVETRFVTGRELFAVDATLGTATVLVAGEGGGTTDSRGDDDGGTPVTPLGPRAGRSGIPDSLRLYAAGDPVASIDWNATARHGVPYVRTVDADADAPVFVVVDAASLPETARDDLPDLLAARLSTLPPETPVGLLVRGSATRSYAPETGPRVRRAMVDAVRRAVGERPAGAASDPPAARRLRARLDATNDRTAFERRLGAFLGPSTRFGPSDVGASLASLRDRVGAGALVWVLTGPTDPDSLSTGVRSLTATGALIDVTVVCTPETAASAAAVVGAVRPHARESALLPVADAAFPLGRGGGR